MSNNSKISESDLSFDIRDLYQDLCAGDGPESGKGITESDFESDPEFVADFLKSKFVELILEGMEKKGLNRTDLAQKLNKSPQYISKIINETANFTIESMAAISCALGMTLEIKMHHKEDTSTLAESVSMPHNTGIFNKFPMDHILPKNCLVDHEEDLLTKTR